MSRRANIVHWCDPEDEWEPLCGDAPGEVVIVDQGAEQVSGLSVYDVCSRCRESGGDGGNDGYEFH